MLNGFTKRKAAVALGTVALLIAATGAFAFWTGLGSGSGTSQAGAGGAVTLTAAVTDGIAPGVSVPVSFAAANPSGAPIRVTTVKLESVAADTEHPDCNTGDFSMANVAENHSVPAGATAEGMPTNGSLAYAVTGVNQDGCKGATLTLTLKSV
jgi:hypothetical protein